jgi:hypothetical protein
MTQKWMSLTQVFYSESTEGNSQRAGQYGLAGGEREGHSGAESDRIRSEGEALKDRRMKSPIEDRWELIGMIRKMRE